MVAPAAVFVVIDKGVARFGHPVRALALAALLAVSLSASAQAGPPPPGSWTPTGPLLEAQASGHTATRLSDGRVLVAGGAESTTTTELYDPKTGTWSPGGCLGDKRAAHIAVTLKDGRVLFAGGLCGAPGQQAVVTATAEVYDPATGRLAPTGSMTRPRNAAAATLLTDGRVLATSGKTAELYDPAATDPATGLKGRWTATGSIQGPTLASGVGTLTALADGRVLLAGGSPGGSPPNSTDDAELYDPATGTWTLTGKLREGRLDHVATLLPGGKVLVAGGRAVGLGGTRTLGSAELYDPATGSWQPTANMGVPRDAASATLLPGGKVLVAGGRSASQSELSAELYDPVSTTWAPTANAPEHLHKFATATRLLDGRVLLLGGDHESQAPEIYDPLGDSWSSPAQPSPHASHTASLLPDGRVLVRGAGGPVSEIYDPASDAWAPFGPRGIGRQAASATLLGDGMVLLAGGIDSGSSPLDSAELYDPASGFSTPTGPLATPRSAHTETRLSDGKVLVAGGLGGEGGALASAELYDPGTRSWGPAGTVGARSGHTASLLPDGRVLVVGGARADGSPTDSAVLYDPASNIWTPVAAVPGPRTDHTATSLPDGRVLVAGGEGAAGDPLGTAAIYGPEGTWAPARALATPRQTHTATLVAGAKVVVAGGTGAGAAKLLSSEVYDPRTDSWAPTDRLSRARAGHSATPLADGRVLAVGGPGEHATELFDPASAPKGSFLPTGSPRYSRTGHSQTALPNGKVLIVGGDGAPQRAEIYNPLSARWSPAAQLTAPHSGHAAVPLADGRVLVAGGGTDAAEVYDPASNNWSSTGSMNEARTNFAVAPMGDGRVLAVGGTGLLSRSAETYDPATGRWTATESSKTERGFDAEAIALAGPGCAPHCGKVLLAGEVGHGSNQALELYDPASNRFDSPGKLAQARPGPTLTRLRDGRVLIAGGEDLATSELYDPQAPDTLASGGLNFATLQDAATLLPNGDVLRLGGFISGEGRSAGAEVYSPGVNRWRYTGRMNGPRGGHTVSTLASGPFSACGENCGKALVVGGTNPDDADDASAELYTPQPEITAISPNADSVAGGARVTITGHGLAAASRVSFGASQAADFVPDADSPESKLHVTVPPHAAGAVDVRVESAGGSSDPSPADRFTFSAAATARPGASDLSLSDLRLRPRRFRRGSRLPRVVSAAAVGTTVSFRVSGPASVTLSFTRIGSGRLVKGRCRPATPSLSPRHKRRCRRLVRLRQGVTVAAHAGLNRLRFQGRLSAGRRLRPGRYRLTASARDAEGNRSAKRTAGFVLLGARR